MDDRGTENTGFVPMICKDDADCSEDGALESGGQDLWCSALMCRTLAWGEIH